MPKFYTTQEVADMLKIREKKVRDYILEGRIKAISLNGSTERKRGQRTLRISEDALNQFLTENTTR